MVRAALRSIIPRWGRTGHRALHVPHGRGALRGQSTVPRIADGFSSSLTPASDDVRHRDGIAFTPGVNPAAGTWRTLPAAPIASFDSSSGAAVLDGSVNFLAPRALMQFDTTSDVWSRHEIPEFTGNRLHAAGDRLVPIAAGFEDVPDHEWDPHAQQWSTVPPTRWAEPDGVPSTPRLASC